MLRWTGNGFSASFHERNSRITSKRSHLRMKHVRTAHTKSRTPNRLVTSLFFRGASSDWKSVSGILYQMTITCQRGSARQCCKSHMPFKGKSSFLTPASSKTIRQKEMKIGITACTIVQCSVMDDSAFLWEHAILDPRPAVTP
jgi:hypothetical protein